MRPHLGKMRSIWAIWIQSGKRALELGKENSIIGVGHWQPRTRKQRGAATSSRRELCRCCSLQGVCLENQSARCWRLGASLLIPQAPGAACGIVYGDHGLHIIPVGPNLFQALALCHGTRQMLRDRGWGWRLRIEELQQLWVASLNISHIFTYLSQIFRFLQGSNEFGATTNQQKNWQSSSCLKYFMNLGDSESVRLTKILAKCDGWFLQRWFCSVTSPCIFEAIHWYHYQGPWPSCISVY